MYTSCEATEIISFFSVEIEGIENLISHLTSFAVMNLVRHLSILKKKKP